jgi:acetate kinase
MNILAISQNISKLEYAVFTEKNQDPIIKGEIKGWMSENVFKNIPYTINMQYRKITRTKEKKILPELICIRSPFGGSEFRHPEFFTTHTIEKLVKIEDEAPMHIPPLIKLINLFQAYFSKPPIVLIFETSFFTSLPEREYIYALEPELATKIPIRKFGYHGIFHQKAYEYISSKEKFKKIISISLEPVPEMCAIKYGKPIMITGGATPLEGLPGETTCGDIDPLIILSLSQDMGWGPEEIDQILSRKSGLFGLTGKKIHFSELFSSKHPDILLTKNIFFYRLLLSTGSAVAAMGNVEEIVFSGRYCQHGKKIYSYISSKISIPNCTIFKKSLLNLIVEIGLVTYLKNKDFSPA